MQQTPWWQGQDHQQGLPLQPPPSLGTGHRVPQPGPRPRHRLLPPAANPRNLSGRSESPTWPRPSILQLRGVPKHVFFWAEPKLYREARQQSSPDTGCHHNSSHGCRVPAEAGARSSNAAVLHVICQCCGTKMPPAPAHGFAALPACSACSSAEERADTRGVVPSGMSLGSLACSRGIRPWAGYSGHLLCVVTEMWTTGCSARASLQNNSGTNLITLEKGSWFQR